ncbi:MAG TPA: hypothetical protein VMW63_03945 [Methanoregulaceae archaeon]|nr:hypothetical protein [Methanoregulaceae archaeon]
MIISLGMLAGIAMADVLPPTPPETQGISTSTVVSSLGYLSHMSSLRWDLSSEVLGANVGIVDPTTEPPEWGVFPEPPLNADGEAQMHCTYSERTDANNGIIGYTRSTEIDTLPNPGAAFNVENDRIFTFRGYEMGRIVSSEDMMMDTVGTPFNAEYSMICPFGVPESDNCIPAFCNRIESGSLIDMSVVSASSSADMRNVNLPGAPRHWPPFPSADDPALFDYGVRVSGLSEDTPSLGLVSAYAEMHGTEGGTECPGDYIAAQEFSFEELRRVDGDVSLFSYLIEYESGVRR